VWAIYVADRLLDVRRPAGEHGESARHGFYRRHRQGARVLLAAIVALDAAVAALWLRPAIFWNAVAPFAAVLAYLLAINAAGRRFRVAKEPVVAFLFTAGTFLVAWTNDRSSPIALLWPAAAFFALCTANLVAIEAWEWRELRDGRDPPQALTRVLVRGLRVWVPLLAVASAAAAAGGRGRWYAAIAISAAGVGALVFAGRRTSIEVRRVLVDAVLLSPAIWL